MVSYIRKMICRLRGEIPTGTLVKLGLKVGENFSRQEQVNIDHSHCWLISLGNNVTLAPRVHILAHDASMHNELGYTRIARVEIGNNVFVGAGTIILPGVTIGDNVIIGAGSVVTHDIMSNSVAVGNPCKAIKKYDQFIMSCKQDFKTVPVYGEEFTLRSKQLDSQKKIQMNSDLLENKKGYVK